MKEPTYRQALRQTWNLVWRHKILWILGLFSILLGQFGFSNFVGQFWSLSADGSYQGIEFLLLSFAIRASGSVWTVVGLVWLAGILLALSVFIVFLATASQGALISYAAEWFKNNRFSSISKSWQKGLANFWSLLGINIIRKILLVLSLLSLACVFRCFFILDNFWINLLFAGALVLLVFISLFISVIAVYASCYVVVDGKGIWLAIKKGWSLFAKHILVSLEVGILLLLLNFVLLAAILAASYAAFLPAVLVWLTAGFASSISLANAGLALGLILWLIFVVLLAGVFNAYTTSAWVYLFTKMHKEGIVSRLFGWFRGLF